MAEKLTEKEIDEYRSVFQIFDKNGDDKISTTELGAVLSKFGQDPSDDKIQEMITEYDTDGNGTIEFKEFLDIMAKKMNETHSDDEIREAFRLFDKDSNGYITGDELKEIMAVLGEDLSDKEVEDMINTADSDADGRINYHEFVRIMTKK